jgi:glycosyltransferase involved in cell wall biosynthesis
MGNLAAIATEGPQRVEGELELTVVMPCLNEAETVAICVTKAMRWIRDAGVDGEVVVADNGSTDNSRELAEAAGARVVIVRRKGYGNALMSGIRAARGTYVIMADADDSYDLENLGPFLARLRSGDDLVMGNRFKGGIEPGAMPWLHKWIGNPGLRSGGMEFASEMVVKASLAKLQIHEVPTTLRPDGRSRAPHLRSFRDGWRHLRFLLLFCPRWVFVYPGLIALSIGAVGTTALTFGSFGRLDIAGLLYAAALMIIGYQALWFGLLMQSYAETRGILPVRARVSRFERAHTLERGLILGVGMIVFGVIVALLSFIRWRQADFGALNPSTNVRTITPAILGLVMGSQTILGSFSIGILSIRTTDEQPAQRAPLETPAPRGT